MKYTEKELAEYVKYSAKELTDMGVCPTCVDRASGGKLFGDKTDLLIYEDDDIECFFVGNPRAPGHMAISAQEHFHDLAEAPDYINEKIIRFIKQFMIIIKEVYGCERVYLCTMSDGPMNHYHVQLIPRYSYEERGSDNFVKPRSKYICDKEKLQKTRELIKNYAKNI